MREWVFILVSTRDERGVFDLAVCVCVCVCVKTVSSHLANYRDLVRKLRRLSVIFTLCGPHPLNTFLKNTADFTFSCRRTLYQIEGSLKIGKTSLYGV